MRHVCIDMVSSKMYLRAIPSNEKLSRVEDSPKNTNERHVFTRSYPPPSISPNADLCIALSLLRGP
jgi:hypothetical protein